MGFFEFNKNFELVVDQPKTEIHQKFTSYIKKKRWEMLSLDEENISFRTNTTLLSFPIDFDVKLTSINESSTKLSVYTERSQVFDFGKSEGIIHDIINEIY